MTNVHCCICFPDAETPEDWIKSGTPGEQPPLCEEHAALWDANDAWEEFAEAHE